MIRRLLKPSQLSSASVDLLRLIPGYDPIATAGDCVFDKTTAERAVNFYHTNLRHLKGPKATKPFILEPWQQSIVCNLFGWKRPDGTRRYREVFILVPRKNGKTAFAAGTVLYVMDEDNEQGAECYSAAAERDQAALVFNDAKGMVLKSPHLSRRIKVFTKALAIEDEGISYKAISADANTKHGYNTHFAVVDELHAQKTRELVDVLETSMGARAQPIFMHITTSDFDRPSICNEKYSYATKVRDGIIDDSTFLPVIYEAKTSDDWKSEETWKKANPNLGVSVSLEYMRTKCKKAIEEPSFTNTFKRLHLNIKTEQDVLWVPIEKWDACKRALVFDMLKGKECFAGLDLASTSDLAAFVMYFPELHALWPIFWLPEETIEVRTRKARIPYKTWTEQGFIRKTDGNVTDYDVIRRDIIELRKVFNIREVAIDRWNSTQLQTQLMGDGFEVVPFGQGFASMSAPSKEFERLITANELQHDGNPVLRWMVSNVSISSDAAGNIKPARDKSTEKIDGVVSSIMGIGRALVRETVTSVYETRGIRTV
jgi:phage terminase large subunit-like protein